MILQETGTRALARTQNGDFGLASPVHTTSARPIGPFNEDYMENRSRMHIGRGYGWDHANREKRKRVRAHRSYHEELVDGTGKLELGTGGSYWSGCAKSLQRYVVGREHDKEFSTKRSQSRSGRSMG